MIRNSCLSQLLALSFDAESSPAIVMAPDDSAEAQQTVLEDDGGPTGWGFAWYPGDDRAAAVIKDPIRTGPTAMSQVLHDWERFRGTQFICHIRGAAKRSSEQDTQPFSRSYAGRDWIFAHNGDLDRGAKEALQLSADSPFEPVGHTDSEHAFCWLLEQIRKRGARRIGDIPYPELHALLRQIDDVGAANLLIADGQDLVAYRDLGGFNDLFYLRRIPPHKESVHRNQHIELQLNHALDENRTVVMISSTPLSNENWTPLERGQMLVTRYASVPWIGTSAGKAVPLSSNARPFTIVDAATAPLRVVVDKPAQSNLSQQSQTTTAVANPNASEQPQQEKSRILTVLHETFFSYDAPVEQSSHLLRLRPVHDLGQEVLDHEFSVSPAQKVRRFEDVFGNQSYQVKIDKNYSELVFRATSRVRVQAPPQLSSPTRRTTIPLIWMPWQRQMMTPYLLPPELPETQLRELSDFGMSFVERQDYNLINTLVDLNESIFRDFSYVSGSTTLATTPFDVYVQRKGVCQDFANLFICLARLMSVPARYRVGYIYTGGYENKVQSDASHAWAEVYLPWLGWLGFDPTNGVIAGLDHVRVACGRNYRDAAPTSGTIFKGGGTETLRVNVRVETEA